MKFLAVALSATAANATLLNLVGLSASANVDIELPTGNPLDTITDLIPTADPITGLLELVPTANPITDTVDDLLELVPTANPITILLESIPTGNPIDDLLELVPTGNPVDDLLELVPTGQPIQTLVDSILGEIPTEFPTLPAVEDLLEFDLLPTDFPATELMVLEGLAQVNELNFENLGASFENDAAGTVEIFGENLTLDLTAGASAFTDAVANPVETAEGLYGNIVGQQVLLETTVDSLFEDPINTVRVNNIVGALRAQGAVQNVFDLFEAAPTTTAAPIAIN